jgi:preprotein translocase subunit SecG
MENIETLVLVLHVLAALAIIGLVLIQHGKGADMGSGFGSGASTTVFGSGGAGNFLTRLTTGIVIAFFLTSFGLAFFAKEKSVAARDLGIPVVEQVEELPAVQEESGELPTFEDSSDSEIPEG